MMLPSLSLMIVLLILLAAAPLTAAPRFDRVDAVIEQAIAEGRCPGAEVLIGRGDDVLHHRVYGHAAVAPTTRPTGPGMIYDLASLTKPIATAMSIMVLHDRRQLSVDDPVARHIPEFVAAGKGAITIAQCLTHTAGFIPDNPMSDYADGKAEALRRIHAAPTRDPPGEKFVYSDVGYIVLGDVVERVSGRPLEQFAAEEIFHPLRMDSTGFKPATNPADRFVPTEKVESEYRIGVVHDPRAYAMGGAAGHAGLFGTAGDVARFCRMLLHHGELDGVRIASTATIEEMLRPRPGPEEKSIRTYGFDVVSGYDSPRGAHFKKDVSFGHTGFTGTSVWIDPDSRVYVILLTSRLHPDGKGDVRKLRFDVATEAAAALRIGQ